MQDIILKSIAILLMLTLAPFALGIAQAEENSVLQATRNISHIYSDIDARLSLMAQKNAAACIDEQCDLNAEFDQRVKNLGAELVAVVYAIYPHLQKKLPHFEFTVANKVAAAATSTASGHVIVFRGLQHMALSDEALSFIIGREIGHVINQHHTQNITTKLLITAVASVVFPALAILSASSTAAQASTATSVATSAASSVTSFVGSEVAIKSAKPNQMAESDNIALNLLMYQGYDVVKVINDLPNNFYNESAWLKDLQLSRTNLEQLFKTQALQFALAPI